MPAWIQNLIASLEGLFSKRTTPTDVVAVNSDSGTNLPLPVPQTKPRPVAHKVIRKPPRDFNPQFPSAKDLALAVRLNPDPRHLIPHMYANEGNSIKYVDIRGGSNTVSVAQLKAAKGIH
jgi:hypothetical protein